MTEIEQFKQQLVELQSQLAFQDDALGHFNEALANQQQEILLLRRQLALLKQRQDEQAQGQAAGQGPGPAEDKPPHY